MKRHEIYKIISRSYALRRNGAYDEKKTIEISDEWKRKGSKKTKV